MHDRHEMGTDGFCICPRCNKKTAHRRGIPCQQERCADCNVKLLREGSYHHQLYQKKHASKPE